MIEYLKFGLIREMSKTHVLFLTFLLNFQITRIKKYIFNVVVHPLAFKVVVQCTPIYLLAILYSSNEVKFKKKVQKLVSI